MIANRPPMVQLRQGQQQQPPDVSTSPSPFVSSSCSASSSSCGVEDYYPSIFAQNSPRQLESLDDDKKNASSIQPMRHAMTPSQQEQPPLENVTSDRSRCHEKSNPPPEPHPQQHTTDRRGGDNGAHHAINQCHDGRHHDNCDYYAKLFAFPCNPVQWKLQKRRFLLFVRVLLRYLQVRDPLTYQRVQRMLSQTWQQQQQQQQRRRWYPSKDARHKKKTMEPYQWRNYSDKNINNSDKNNNNNNNNHRRDEISVLLQIHFDLEQLVSVEQWNLGLVYMDCLIRKFRQHQLLRRRWRRLEEHQQQQRRLQQEPDGEQHWQVAMARQRNDNNNDNDNNYRESNNRHRPLVQEAANNNAAGSLTRPVVIAMDGS